MIEILNSDLLNYVIIMLVAVVCIKTIFGRSQYGSAYKMFKVSPLKYKLIGWDLGKKIKPMNIHLEDIGGIPDAIFKHRFRNKIVIGEYKHRVYGKGVRDYEKYQVLLYQDILRKDGYHQVNGYLRYKDRMVRIYYNRIQADRLMTLIPELRASKKAGKPVNSTPLKLRSGYR